MAFLFTYDRNNTLALAYPLLRILARLQSLDRDEKRAIYFRHVGKLDEIERGNRR